MNNKTIVKIIAVLVAVLPTLAYAADGQILINQATVTSAGGFPYVISKPGSYKLSGNLVVPANLSGIVITSSAVSIDLNGFNISSLGYA